MKISYEEMLKKDVIMSLSSHDKVIWESSRCREERGQYISFWKCRGNHYEYRFKIHISDMYSVIKSMEHCHRFLEEDIPANMYINYCLVPDVYINTYYYYKTFCRFLLFCNCEEMLNLSSENFWLPINPKLWREKLANKPKIKLDFQITVNGKEVNKPLSYETAKRLGIVE